jgi:hypothetical protein
MIVFLLLFVVCVTAQAAPEIAYDLFIYNYNIANSYKTTPGGAGLRQMWREQVGTEFGCEVQRFVANVTRPSVIVYASPQDSVMVGAAYSGTKYCSIARTFANSPFGTPTGTVYVSALFTSLSQSTNKDGAFAVAVGDDTTVDNWNPENNNLYISGTAVIAMRAIRHQQGFTFQMSNGGASMQFNTVGSANGPFAVFCVIRYEWTDPKRVTARFYPFDFANGTREVSESLVLASPPSVYTSFDANKLTAISTAMLRFNVAQVRVGFTFNSVYADLPSQLTTRQSTATAPRPTPMPSIASTTTTTTTTTTNILPSGVSSTASSSLMTTRSSSNSTTSPNISSTLSNASQSQSQSNMDSLPIACETVAGSCMSCLAVSGCRWCSRGRHVESGECTSTPGDDCVLLTQSVVGCSEDDADNMMNEESLPVATIAGAVGGSIAALLIVGAIVAFFVLRSRRNKQQQSHSSLSLGDRQSVEMATTRESPSIAMSSNTTYGNLRLATTEYSTAGLPQQSGTVTTGTQTQYTEMEMK